MNFRELLRESSVTTAVKALNMKNIEKQGKSSKISGDSMLELVCERMPVVK